LKRSRTEEVFETKDDNSGLVLEAARDETTWDWDLSDDLITVQQTWAACFGLGGRRNPGTYDDFRGLPNPDDRERVLGASKTL